MIASNAKLAYALVAAGLYHMADRAADGYYHDFLSPLDAPTTQLVNDLQQAGTPSAMLIREQVIAGDFDATLDEAEAWAKTPDGQQAASLFGHLPWPSKTPPQKN